MERKALILATAVLSALPSVAGAQSFRTTAQAFGGLTFDTSSSTLGGMSTAPSLGGVVTGALTPNVHIVGEVGRLSDIKPSLYDLLEFTPVELRVSAWYGEGGVRFIASPRSAVRPYAEATAGMARLSTGLSGFGGRTDVLIDLGLQYLNRTEPLLGAGAGVLLEHGPLSLDVGYRYKKILAEGVASTINAGNPYQINEARIGIGFRF